MAKPNIFFRLTKVDIAKRLVEGIATAEEIDKSGEICDYESTKPYYQKWSDGIKKATDGKSLGNVREMHSNIAAGKVVDLLFDDVSKTIRVVAKVVEDSSWNKVLEGVLTGFSQGGEYVKRWKDVSKDAMRYTAEPSEISLVDNPCLAEATFEVIKADGTSEMHKFVQPTKAVEPEVEQGWRAKDGSFHKTKALALKKNIDVDAETEAQAAIADTKKALGEVSDDIKKREPARIDFDKFTKSSEAWDAALALDALMTIESLLCGETYEAFMGEENDPGQIADLKECAARLKSFIASEIQESEEGDGEEEILAMSAAALDLLKGESGEHVGGIHKSATDIMNRCMKCMGGTEKSANDELAKDGTAHFKKMHKAASAIADRCVKMGSSFKEGEAGTEEDTAEKVTKLAKAEALNSSLQKALGEVNTMVAQLNKRIENLEKQPALRKGALFAIERGHEVQPGDEPVETVNKVNISALRLSPEEQRRLHGF